jgi:AcrR family transcriptional regulator
MNQVRAGGRAGQTREALLRAALAVFGRDGFHAASNRAISEAAGVNQALIAYHYGGKEGLYRAAIEHITENIARHMGPLLETLRQEIAALDASTTAGRAACLAQLDQILARVITFFGQPEAGHWVKLVMREQQDPTAAFDIFYEGIYSEMLAMITGLVGKLTGQPSELEATRALALTLVGQILVFVVGRATISRHLGWIHLDQREREVLHATVRQTLYLRFDARELL